MDKPAQGPPQRVELQIKVDEKELFGASYSTLAQIFHTGEEFTFDFFYVTSNPPAGTLVKRILVSPGHAKRLLAALQDNIKKYEAQFGEIKSTPVPEPKIGFVN